MILARGVTKVYRGDGAETWALRGVDLEVKQGEFVAVVGPSGSGKSTLLYILGGLLRPTSGTVRVAGMELTEMSDSELAEFRHWNIGFVFQMYHLIPRMTALKNVMLPLMLRGLPLSEARDRALEALKLVGLEHRANHRPAQLSGGEQQRVAIARAIVTKPKILLADEPTGNVDRRSAFQIMEIFSMLRKELGITIVMVTHNLELVKFCDWAARLVDGRIARKYGASEYEQLVRDMVSSEEEIKNVFI